MLWFVSRLSCVFDLLVSQHWNILWPTLIKQLTVAYSRFLGTHNNVGAWHSCLVQFVTLAQPVVDLQFLWCLLVLHQENWGILNGYFKILFCLEVILQKSFEDFALISQSNLLDSWVTYLQFNLLFEYFEAFCGILIQSRIDEHEFLDESVDGCFERHVSLDDIIDPLACEPVDSNKCSWDLPVADFFSSICKLIVQNCVFRVLL